MRWRVCAGGPRWTSQGRPDAQRPDSPKLIPRVLHQTYQSGAVPPGVRPLMHSWRRHNEDWEIRFYDDEACLKFVQREFPEYLDAFRALPRDVERSHFFRRAAPAAGQGACVWSAHQRSEPARRENLRPRLLCPWSRLVWCTCRTCCIVETWSSPPGGRAVSAGSLCAGGESPQR
jgi:hypothetical protein